MRVVLQCMSLRVALRRPPSPADACPMLVAQRKTYLLALSFTDFDPIGDIVMGMPIAGVTEYLAGSRGSLRLDARKLDHLGPFFGLVAEELAKIGRRARKHRAATVSETRSLARDRRGLH